jgi:hypothetical protein
MRMEEIAMSAGVLRRRLPERAGVNRLFRTATCVVALMLGGNVVEWPYFDELAEQDEFIAQGIDNGCSSEDDDGAATSTRADGVVLEVLLHLRLIAGIAATVVARAGSCADFPAVAFRFRSRFPEASSRPPPGFGF